MFIVVIVISILLKSTFSQISIHSQLLVKILKRSDKEKNTLKAIENYRYGLRKTVSKHLNNGNMYNFLLVKDIFLSLTECLLVWKLFIIQNFDRFQTYFATTSNNMQQSVQTDATYNIQKCWELLANNIVSACTGL